ncbi:HNH endonuclease [Bradyrhizobium sp. Arg68]|uniref:HNH endonuclease n=1 Tax=Bradyrhizobium ivorense TaxID=2511166 RepID=UPI001E56B714|nr:HNH endonuclease [Bradyrhizobium ivorense]MCC8939087.1 HNH endonuclease [Bradyrhizobium ivorense]
MSSPSDDALIRAAAFAALDQLMMGRSVLPWGDIEAGFMAPGYDYRLRFGSRAKGIFKPKEMSGVLSLRTVMPRHGRRVWYRDQDESREALYAADSTVRYSFRGDDPTSSDNLLLRLACERQTPLIYFLAVAPAVYVPIYPTFVVVWEPQRLEASLAFASTSAGKIVALPANAIERRYRLSEVKQRVHQAEFREAVLDAYGSRCAITGLPVRLLLDASHIVPDGDENWGQPQIPNGLPLSKIHHAAFDANLIGIDPDGFVRISEQLLNDCREGDLLKAIETMRGCRIRPPKLDEDRPDRDRLALRFESYLAAN